MKEYTYDFHVHTCLSPCGDNEMTPNNIVNLAILAECDILAVTDHNSCKNAPAVMAAARETDLLVIPGMELCVAEEAHVICLFETLDGAMSFDKYVEDHTPSVINRPEVFGEQRICDAADQVIGFEEKLLLIASEIGVNQVVDLIKKFGGCAFPAHVDRNAFSVIASLGAIPPEANFQTAELTLNCDEPAFVQQHIELQKMRILKNSDAHYLEVLAGKKKSIELPEKSIKEVFKLITEL